ncbi:hypothetical protein A4X06_0g8833 [Tilletia controversa]|uniref:Uncharacterized protein n=2 Tax=Tilletia TaxID=13289 RepID=A0A8X7MK47_9BASI|nr:hypothetical protein A4X06_0g8833 [Tilletia controversa]
MGVDIKEAFYNISTHPTQRPHLCVRLGENRNYVRASSPFGHKAICAIFGRSVDCSSDIVSVRLPGIQLRAWVDDISSIRPGGPASGITEAQVRSELQRLGWPLHPPEKKGFNFSRQFTMTGVEWDLDTMTMTLPEDKRTKYLARATEIIDHPRRKVNRTEMDKLIGCLFRVCQFAPGQRCQLHHLLGFRRRLHAPYVHLHLPSSPLAELKAWQQFLSTTPIRRCFLPPARVTSTLYASDACDVGLGITCGQFAKFWPLPPGWKQIQGYDMGPAEAWAMEALVNAAILLGESDCVLRILGDNQGVLHGWMKGRSASGEVNDCFSRMFSRVASLSIEISATYVDTKSNPADRVSRGDVSGYLPFPFQLQDPWPYIAGVLPRA